FNTVFHKDLKFKLYLITEKGIQDNIQNSYCPLYLWKGHNGLNQFLFNGFYDNIINSFGWQQINICIPLIDTTSSKVIENNYLFQITREILPQESLNNLIEKISEEIPSVEGSEFLVSYNPDKWEYHVFYFLNDLSKLPETNGVIYTILHISQEEIPI
ncbi:DUF4865 domain-containing protein, partial [Bacillus sp. AFS076308]|uniref:DUF4865 family protein n=1 Tax=Bacillus sp. AFS076308 TaxID=2033512 RepID=UPI000BF47A05